MKNILLLTDFSKNAWNAIFMALKLYAAWDCKFYLLHTFEPKDWKMVPNQGDSGSFEINSPVEHGLEERMEATKNYLIKNNVNSDHSFEALLVAGSLVDTIRVLISRYDLDMVVMGTHGTTKSKKFFVGNNALQVLRKVSNCPILLVPESFDFQGLTSIAFPTEFMYFTPKYVLSPLLELLKKWKSSINIIFIAQEYRMTEEQKTNWDILNKRLKGFPVSFIEIPISSKVSKDILKAALDLETELIVLTQYSHSFFEKLIQEPIIKRTVSKTTVPLLVLPDFTPG